MRRHGTVIMGKLILMLGNLSSIMLLAVINGSIGFICSTSITLLGAIGVAKLLGESIIISYELLCVLIVVFGVLRGILRYFEQYSNHYIAFRLLANLRSKLFVALRRLSPSKLEGREKGALIALVTSDIETIEVFYAHTISPILIAVIVSVGMVTFISLFCSFYMGFIALISYFIIGVILPIIGSKALKKSGVEYRDAFAKSNSCFLESILGVQDIVIHNSVESRIDLINENEKVLFAQNRKIKNRASTIQALSDISVTICVIAMMTVGSILVVNGIITFPIMLVGVVALMSSFAPTLAISALPSNLTHTLASGERLLNLLEEKPIVDEIKNGDNFEFSELKVENLSFDYGDTCVLNNINLQVKLGEIVGIVGKSGCGKSTLLKLLLRFWSTTGGNISYNGIGIDKIKTKSLRENVVMVSQNTYLFDDTIKNNMLIAKENATDEEIFTACKKASIHEWISSLPNGYDTNVGVLGTNLSAGERQRIGIARAFLSDAKLILLDEPTSNIDSLNEGIFLKSIMDNKKDKAFILVTHRKSTLSVADRYYEIIGGAIND